MSWICYVAGKTGGHIIPGLTLAIRDLKNNGQSQLLFITTDNQLDKAIMSQYTATWVDKHVALGLGSVQYGTVFGKIKFLWALASAFVRAFKILCMYKPEKVVSMGGYISLPVCYAAFVLRIPVIVYELNVVPGAAVKALAPIAREIHICFAQAQKYFKGPITTVVPYPVRFTEYDVLDAQQARGTLNVRLDWFTLFVCGGSQGSRFINNFMQELSPLIMTKRVQVIHQTGEKDVEAMRAWYALVGIPAVVFAYRSDINVCYSAADRIITRAGAGALFEILFFQKKALVIPLVTKTTDHQVDNARAMQQEHSDLFMVALQDEVNAKRETIEKFLLSN